MVWMIVEALVSVSAACIARSPALMAFGGDSAGRRCRCRFPASLRAPRVQSFRFNASAESVEAVSRRMPQISFCHLAPS